MFQIGNTAQTVLGWYGVLKAGLIPVCALEQHRHREIDEIARRTETAAHLVQADLPRFDLVAFAWEVAGRQPTMSHLITINSTDPAENADRLEDLGGDGDPQVARRRVDEVQAAIDPDEVAVLQLSGGTTSVPKAIPRLHAEYWYNARAYADFWGWGLADRPTHLLPVVHNAGIICGLHAAHAAGACFVLGTHDPAVFVPLVAAEEAGEVWKKDGVRLKQEITRYIADPETCDACALKSRCTDGKSGRAVARSFGEEYYDRVRSYRGTFPYEKALRKRKVWIEPLFAEAKQWHGMERMRLRTLERVNTEVLVTAAGQNVKRLLEFGPRMPGRAAPAAALRPPERRCLRPVHRRRTAQRGVYQHAVRKPCDGPLWFRGLHDNLFC